MGSVIDYVECPNCENEETHSEFWYKTGEESVFCFKCGYSRKAFIKNRDKKLDELTDEDWDISEVKNPYGCFKISSKDNPGSMCGTFETEEELKELISNLEERDSNLDEFIVSRFVDGEIKETIIKKI